MATAIQEIIPNQTTSTLQPQMVNIHEISSNISYSFWGLWMIFLDVRKNKNVHWYGTNALMRGPAGNCMLICRSYEAGSKTHSQFLILREALIRMKELNSIHWEIYPAFNDICFLTKQMQDIQFMHNWHPRRGNWQPRHPHWILRSAGHSIHILLLIVLFMSYFAYCFF